MNILSNVRTLDTLDLHLLVPNLPILMILLISSTIGIMLACPVLLFMAGQRYLKKPAPMPTLEHGFRTHFGMGSKSAWDYTQQLAGKLFTRLAVVLEALSVLTLLLFIGRNASQMMGLVMLCMVVQAVTVCGSALLIMVLAMINYDKDGRLRK